MYVAGVPCIGGRIPAPSWGHVLRLRNLGHVAFPSVSFYAGGSEVEWVRSPISNLLRNLGHSVRPTCLLLRSCRLRQSPA